jgi:hypothetical protein
MSFWVFLSIGVTKSYFLSRIKKIKIQPMMPKQQKQQSGCSPVTPLVCVTRQPVSGGRCYGRWAAP